MRRLRFLWVLVAVIVAGAVWQLLFNGKTVGPTVIVPRATATIGSGADAVAVGPGGQLLGWLPVSEDAQLPALPLTAPPRNGRLAGPVLQQAKVLGAAPAGLRPYLESSYDGESGVDVRLRSGIELRFGDASQVRAKWKAAAAVLADPSVTSLDYVDLHAPGRPAVGGSGHTLPPVE
ncbi:MAG TPA: cell division protein FtsQ/DivIB [Solirubrobacterales bacterium]|nr:cell division protein FtsQ/DivIB [Solirubrobacterales bacterium]